MGPRRPTLVRRARAFHLLQHFGQLLRYTFERGVTFKEADGSQAKGRIDLYKSTCFLLETKQGTFTKAKEQGTLLDFIPAKAKQKTGHGKRGTAAFDKVLQRAYNQGRKYITALPAAEGRPPFLIICDLGHSIELYAEFTGTGGQYERFPDTVSHRITLADLHRPEIRERLRKVWTDPHSLDPSNPAFSSWHLQKPNWSPSARRWRNSSTTIGRRWTCGSAWISTGGSRGKAWSSSTSAPPCSLPTVRSRTRWRRRPMCAVRSSGRSIGSGRISSGTPISDNRGVERDEQIGTATAGVMLRRVTYTAPDSGTTYEFLTNEMTLRPGVIALLYRMRWDIEKVFGELKNKHHQTKPWAKSATAKEMQVQFICLAHNLMLLLGSKPAGEGVGNATEIKRRARGTRPAPACG